MSWIEKITGSFEQKKQYRRHKERIAALPGVYRTAAEGLERFAMYASGITDGGTLVTMLGDLVDLFEEHAASGTPLRQIVGDDPVEFAEDFLANYHEDHWLGKERRRLKATIARAEEES